MKSTYSTRNRVTIKLVYTFEMQKLIMSDNECGPNCLSLWIRANKTTIKKHTPLSPIRGRRCLSKPVLTPLTCLVSGKRDIKFIIVFMFM